MAQASRIKVEAIINAPVANAWEVWNNPGDIMQWNTADPSWHCPESVNNLKTGGRFRNRMEARDGSFGFDFEGIYDNVELHKEITYTMADGRKATTLFTEQNGKTYIETTFDAEAENDPELQKQGWQAILNNFAKYLESKTISQ